MRGDEEMVVDSDGGLRTLLPTSKRESMPVVSSESDPDETAA